MKHYLCKTKIQDGEHEYELYLIYDAKSTNDATTQSRAEDKRASNFIREYCTEWVQEISPTEERVLKKFGVI